MKKSISKARTLFSLLLIICSLFSVFNAEIYADSSRIINSDYHDAYCQKDVEIGYRLKDLIFGKKKTKSESTTPLYLCPGGDAFGVKIIGGNVTVTEVITERATEGLCENDKITKIDGQEIFSIEDIKEALASFQGGELSFEILRNNKTITLELEPCRIGNEYHLGVILSDGATGIGTITYYDKNTGNFGGLGHGICEKDGGNLLNMKSGYATGVILAGASRPVGSRPGELRGVLTDKILGNITMNTACGIFGTLDLDNNIRITETEPMEVGKKTEIHKGEATIYSTIKSGKRAEYSITIEDIDYSSDNSKSFRIKITDPALISLSGGIVRGMSGSPIIQDGKLVGAVTHVMVADPTEGYGIFIENMLSAAEMPLQKAA